MLAACEHTLDQKTSAWIARRGHHIYRSSQQPLNHRARRRLIQRLAEISGWASLVTVEHLSEQGFLIAKSRVKTRTVDAHRFRKIGQRGPFVTLVPEHSHRRLQGLASFKGAGTPERPRCRIPFHINLMRLITYRSVIIMSLLPHATHLYCTVQNSQCRIKNFGTQTKK